MNDRELQLKLQTIDADYQIEVFKLQEDYLQRLEDLRLRKFERHHRARIEYRNSWPKIIKTPWGILFA